MEKLTMKKKILIFLLSCVLAVCSLVLPACGEEQVEKNQVIILYTNDVHAYLDNDSEDENGLSYAHLANLKNNLGDNVLVVDAGDHIQGSVYGAMDQGESVLEIMNGIYDLATLGNHEFDYGVQRTLSLTNSSAYPYISCNFVHKASGETVLSPHALLKVGNVKVGFVGISTPETITSTAPSYFQNSEGEYIYDFLEGDRLYSAIQSSINTLNSEGADYVVALGHVGVDQLSKTTSRIIIENVSGLDAFIDGHSHTEVVEEIVKDKNNNDVVLTQTGNYFNGIGKMVLSDKGIETSLITQYSGQDQTVLNLKNEWVSEVDGMLGSKIATLSNKLTIEDENGDRLVRVNSTNLGDFVADSYYYYVNSVAGIDCDLAIINGGGVRATIQAGEVSYKDLKSVTPFGNMLCAVQLTGQQIIDMLEWGGRSTTGVAGQYEEGSFLHTAGLKYTIDTSITATVQMDDKEVWLGAPTGEYRVSDVKVYDKQSMSYVDLVLTKTYVVAGANFTLIDRGDGFEMINGITVSDFIVEDFMALATYAIAFEDTNGDNLSDVCTANSPLNIYQNFGINYEEITGANRILIVK